ncbi:hypothetical protein [Nonomuraea indica]|uniref:hypothetical protein n=1 Tax=Nonomuraea indica TaxID=1581193 RepID=UPI0011835732|nr:hypothetical protein [Nonomuraea indica]
MGWARIDDAFDDHEKVLALLDLDEGVAALGLWTLCLTWAHRNTRKKSKTPGLLPSTLPRRFVGSRGRELAALLVDAGMWDVLDDGWMIHDFAEYLPDKEVSAARSAAGKRGAASRWGNKRTDGNLPSRDSKTDGKHVAADSSEGAADASDAPEGADDVDILPADGKLLSEDGNLPSVSHLADGKAVASDGSRAGARRVRAWVGVQGSVRTSVTLPHEQPTPAESVASGDAVLIELPSAKARQPESGSDDDPNWLRFWDAYPRKASKQGARGKWAKAIREGVDPELIIAGAIRYADEMRAKRTPKDKIKHPDGWLYGRRWEDEPETFGRGFNDIEECAPEEFNW